MIQWIAFLIATGSVSSSLLKWATDNTASKYYRNLHCKNRKQAARHSYFLKVSESKSGKPFVFWGIGKERSCHHCVLECTRFSWCSVIVSGGTWKNRICHHCFPECTRFSCSVIRCLRLWRWLSVSKILPSQLSNYHNFLNIEEQNFICTLPWKVEFLRTVSKTATCWWGLAHQRKNGRSTRFDELETELKKNSKAFSCVAVFEVFVLKTFGLKVKYS